MTSYSVDWEKMRKYNSVLFSVLIALTCFVATRGQGGVGSTRGLTETVGGSNIIQGHVYVPGQSVTGKRIRVSLESADDQTKTSLTDDDGTFRFNGLRSGAYTVVVEGGKDYETARESVFFEGGNRNTMVPIYLRLRIENLPEFASIPRPAVDAYRKGRELSQKGDHKKAADQFVVAVSAAPNFGLALSDLGAEYLKLKDPAKAAEALEHAVKLRPEDFTTRLNYGIALLNLKKFSESEEQLSVAAKQNDASGLAHYYLGLALVNEKKYSDAQREFEVAIKNGADQMPLAHKYLGGIYWGAKDFQRAADELEKYVELDPKAPDVGKIKDTIKQLRSEKKG